MNEMAPNPFILADIESCLAAAKKRLKEAESENSPKTEHHNEYINQIKLDIEYYEGWLSKGYKYLNLDSANRNPALGSFLDDKDGYTIQKGFYSWVVNGKPFGIPLEENTSWSELSADFQASFKSSSVDITVYKNATRVDLSEIYNRVNNGVTMNSAEKRNGVVSKTSKYVRDLTTTQVDFFGGTGPYNGTKSFYSPSDINRRKLDENMVIIPMVKHGINRKLI